MNINKKIEKELLFKNNIKDITSISLDSDYKIEGNEIIGNFLINGDYKIHEVSINREKFNFKIPFKEKIENDIEENTIKLEIINFEYDYRKDELLVNIEYELTGDRKDILIFDDKESLEEFLEKREIEVIDTRIDTIKKEVEEIENITNDNNIKQKEITENNIIRVETKEMLDIDEKDRNISIEETNEEMIKPDHLMNNLNKPTDNFITYKIYKVEENDTLEGIVLKYKTTLDDLKEYNDLNNIQINDKLIIPYYE